MTRGTLLCLAAWSACLLACTSGGSQPSKESKDIAAEHGLEARAEEYEVPDEPVLPRGHAPLGVLSEVVLDPLGTAALTLDTAGGVQLWPALAAEAPDNAKTWPMTLPLQEPLWLSFARTNETYADGSFLLAIIDTSNALQVFGIDSIEEKLDNVWQLEPRFALPPTDPMLEAHVLAGGERIVALGEDHSIRLYDGQGVLVSQLTQPGFVPWQLRVGAMDEAGRVGMLAVLTQPLRVQSIVLRDDQLRLEGEARAVELDRGPNRNDLELSPDGRTVAALRRAFAKGKNWSVELIDLASDERKLIAGKVDVTVRPRMHFVDDTRLLLESGGGSGYWVELGKAKPLRKPEDADPESSVAKSMADRMADEHTKVRLAGAVERREELPDGDRGLRYQSTTAKGIRAAVDDGVLIIDPLDQPHHLELGFRSASLGPIALLDEVIALSDHASEQDDKLIFFSQNRLDHMTWPEPQAHTLAGAIASLDFVDEATLLAVVRAPTGQPMRVHVFSDVEGEWGQSGIVQLPIVGDALNKVAIHTQVDDDTVAIVGMLVGDQRLLAYVEYKQATVEMRALEQKDHPAWPELLTPAELAAITSQQETRFRESYVHVDGATIFASGERVTRESTTASEPDWIAIVPAHADRVELSYGETVVAVRSRMGAALTDDREHSAIWLFLDAKTGARLWSTELSPTDRLAWDADHGGDEPPLEWALLTRGDALEIVDARTGERVSFVRGLGPAWRSVPDEQAPTRFSSDHVNTQPLTVRSP